jgi:hypothetical protein
MFCRFCCAVTTILLTTAFLCPGVASAQVAAGCVAYYPFTGNADDACGSGNHGSVTGATLTADRLGNSNRAYEFDGSGDFILVPDSDSLDLSDGFTAAAWIKPTTTSGADVMQKLGAYTLDIYPGTIRSVLTSASSGQGVVYGSTSIQADQWQHIAVTWDSAAGLKDFTTVTAFLNGVPDGTGLFEGPIQSTADPVYIGRYLGLYFHGVIDELWIFDRELSTNEINDLMNLLMFNGFESGDLGGWQ